jgi:spermidine synthase
MFTNEFDYDATVTTLLDDTNECDDVEVTIDDAGVFIRQYNEITDKYDLIVMSHRQFQEFLIAMRTTEGAYKTSFEKNEKK